MHPVVNNAVNAARSASKVILRMMGHVDTYNISEKSRNDFVTEVDKLAEAEIIKILKKTYPDHTIIAEESGLIDGDEDYVWLIDPLDGTTNYIHGIPHFAISIAMKHKNKLEHGVIFDPIRNELFTASRGEGARLNERRIRVSQQIRLEKALIGTGFPFKHIDLIKTYLNAFEAILPHTGGMRRAGAAALDLAYVAAGRFDGFWEFFLSPWDMAAGALLIKEAGGLVGDADGGEDYLNTGNIVCGNPKIFKALLQLIKPKVADIRKVKS